jgi:hypothetical protein
MRAVQRSDDDTAEWAIIRHLDRCDGVDLVVPGQVFLFVGKQGLLV